MILCGQHLLCLSWALEKWTSSFLFLAHLCQALKAMHLPAKLQDKELDRDCLTLVHFWFFFFIYIYLCIFQLLSSFWKAMKANSQEHLVWCEVSLAHSFSLNTSFLSWATLVFPALHVVTPSVLSFMVLALVTHRWSFPLIDLTHLSISPTCQALGVWRKSALTSAVGSRVRVNLG